MPALANPRQERFALFMAQGLTYIDAYEKAGYKRNDGHSSTKARQPKIQARVKELVGELAKKAEITTEKLIQDAQDIKDGAIKAGQWAAATAALKELGILSGKRVERTEKGGPGEFDKLSTQELISELKELGLDVKDSELQ